MQSLFEALQLQVREDQVPTHQRRRRVGRLLHLRSDRLLPCALGDSTGQWELVEASLEAAARRVERRKLKELELHCDLPLPVRPRTDGAEHAQGKEEHHIRCAVHC